MNDPLSKPQIRKILARNPGSKAELMRRCGVSSAAIASFLKHGTSAPTMAKAQILCRELLAKEEQERLSKGDANGPSARRIVEGLRHGDPEVKPIVEKLIEKKGESDR